MVMLGARIVIRTSCRRNILRDLVRMHQGSTKLRQRARLSLYWPDMDNDIENAADPVATALNYFLSIFPSLYSRSLYSRNCDSAFRTNSRRPRHNQEQRLLDFGTPV